MVLLIDSSTGCPMAGLAASTRTATSVHLASDRLNPQFVVPAPLMRSPCSYLETCFRSTVKLSGSLRAPSKPNTLFVTLDPCEKTTRLVPWTSLEIRHPIPSTTRKIGDDVVIREQHAKRPAPT